jgi:hypothetical protein
MGRQVSPSRAVHTVHAATARGGPQSNHRSWADFYLDVVATDGNAQMLSRMAVAYVFPMFMVAVRIIRSVILFKRGRKVDHEARPQAARRRPVRRAHLCTVPRSCGGPHSPGGLEGAGLRGGRPVGSAACPVAAAHAQAGARVQPGLIRGCLPGGRSSTACWSGAWRPAPWTA